MSARGLVALTCLALAASAGSQTILKAQAENGPLKAFQFGVVDLDRLDREWAVPGEGVRLSTTSSTVRNKPIFIAFVFSGCVAKADGACDVTADFQVLAPDGKVYADQKAAPAWPRAPLGPSLLMLSDAKLGLRIENGEALGTYTVRIVIHDNVAKRDVAIQDEIQVGEAPAA